MDLRITKKRFEEHWLYDWIKYIAVIFLCIFIVSFFYQVTTRRLNDKEELRIVFFGTYIGELEAYNTKKDFYEYMKEVELKDSSFLDCSVEKFAKLNTEDAYQASTIKLDGEKDLNVADIYFLPKIDGDTYLNEDGLLKDGANYTFDMYVGKYRYFIPIDELIKDEKDNGNPVAFELEQKLLTDDYYYNCKSKSVDTTLITYDKITEVYTDVDGDGNPISRNYGIDLSKLDKTKTVHLIRDEAGLATTVCNYVLGVKRSSGSYAEAICFINWFIDNYTIQN